MTSFDNNNPHLSYLKCRLVTIILFCIIPLGFTTTLFVQFTLDGQLCDKFQRMDSECIIRYAFAIEHVICILFGIFAIMAMFFPSSLRLYRLYLSATTIVTLMTLCATIRYYIIVRQSDVPVIGVIVLLYGFIATGGAGFCIYHIFKVEPAYRIYGDNAYQLNVTPRSNNTEMSSTP